MIGCRFGYISKCTAGFALIQLLVVPTRGRCSQRRSAFTLIELLVVIAIIAILAAILFPVFAKARESARMSSCSSNIKSLAMGAVMYSHDYDEQFPRLAMGSRCAAWGFVPRTVAAQTACPRPFFMNLIQPYVKNYAITHCPSIGNVKWPELAQFERFQYSAANEDLYIGAYSQIAVNIWLSNYCAVPFPLLGTGGCTTSDANMARVSRIARPGEVTLMAGESLWEWRGQYFATFVGNTGVWPYNPRAGCSGAYGAEGWTWYMHKDAGGLSGRTTVYPGYSAQSRDNGFANVGFADGHVKPMRWERLEGCRQFPEAGNRMLYTHWDWRY